MTLIIMFSSVSKKNVLARENALAQLAEIAVAVSEFLLKTDTIAPHYKVFQNSI